jgi:hypothetical protein
MDELMPHPWGLFGSLLGKIFAGVSEPHVIPSVRCQNRLTKI